MRFLVKRLVRRAGDGGWTHDDLFVVPDHGQQFLGLDHHHVVHVQCASEPELQRFIDHMARAGYRLPDEIPDATFKRPHWMT
jgi:hypothetical protein